MRSRRWSNSAHRTSCIWNKSQENNDVSHVNKYKEARGVHVCEHTVALDKRTAIDGVGWVTRIATGSGVWPYAFLGVLASSGIQCNVVGINIWYLIVRV